MFKIRVLAAALACAAAASLSACGTLGGLTLPTASPAAQQQFLDNLDKINTAAAQHCTGGGDFSWTPPIPPTGSLHMHCEIGALPAASQLPPALTAALAQAGFVPAPAATAPAAAPK